MQKVVLPLLLAAVCLFPASKLFATVTLPRVISDHMVLEQGVPAPIWGTADPSEAITVTINNQTKTTTADAQGKWMVKLDPLPAADTATTLTINSTVIKDVLVGEVWIGSGQSNLETDVYDYTKEDTVLADAAKVPHPLIHIYRSDVGSGWQVITPDTLRRFSAQFFFFGVKLQEALNTPVGLMEGALRGSPASPWLSQDDFKANAELQKAAADMEARNPIDARMQKFNDAQAKLQADLDAATAAGTTDDKLSPELKKYKESMAKWQAAIDAAKAAGTPDDKLPKKPGTPTPYTDVKTGDLFEKHIRPMIPYAFKGVLWDQGEGGSGFSDDFHIWWPMVMKAIIPAWRADWGQGDFPWLYVEKPSGQGQALDPANPVNNQSSAVTALPKDPPTWQPGWPPRYDYLALKDALPNVYMVTASDLAECRPLTNPHPHIKSGYGTRDAQVALGAVYGKPVEFYGPVFQSMTTEGDKVRLTFSHVGKGLTTPQNQPVQGFAVAGDDKKFHWATATIDGQNIVLSCPDVASPAWVVYAWAPFDITWANLFNVDGLPAIPFHAPTKPAAK